MLLRRCQPPANEVFGACSVAPVLLHSLASPYSNLTLMLDIIALPPSPTSPTPIQAPPAAPIVSVARLIIYHHVRISRLYPYLCKPLADLADEFQLFSQCSKNRRPAAHCRRDRSTVHLQPHHPIIAPASLPHQRRITGPSKSPSTSGAHATRITTVTNTYVPCTSANTAQILSWPCSRSSLHRLNIHSKSTTPSLVVRSAQTLRDAMRGDVYTT